MPQAASPGPTRCDHMPNATPCLSRATHLYDGCTSTWYSSLRQCAMGSKAPGMLYTVTVAVNCPDAPHGSTAAAASSHHSRGPQPPCPRPER